MINSLIRFIKFPWYLLGWIVLCSTYSVTGQSSTLKVTLKTTGETCINRADGNAEVSVQGGKAPYKYLWFKGEGAFPVDSASAKEIFFGPAILKELSGSALTVIVTDKKGKSGKASSKITSAGPLILSVSKTDNACPADRDGAISLNLDKNRTFTYQWSNGETTKDISGLRTGVYTVTITDSESCQEVRSIEVTSLSTLQAAMVTTFVNCLHDKNGSIGLDVTGGVKPYRYAWSNGHTTKDLAEIAKGNYVVTITDSAGCVLIDTGFIESNSNMTVDISTINASCEGSADGQINLHISGAVDPVTLKWSHGDSTLNVSQLMAGHYHFIVTDDVLCQAMDSVTISDQPPLALSLNGTHASCAGWPTGTAQVKVSGGTPGYSFLWSNNIEAQDVSALAPGTYKVTVTDTNGCNTTDSIVIRMDTFSIKAVGTHECFGQSDGKIEVEKKGGLEPYAYLWNDATREESLTDLPAGTYSVSVVDNQGCSDRDSIILNNLSLTPLLSVTDVSKKDARDGSVKVTVSGDAPPFFFSWSTGESSQNLSGLIAGTYAVTVTDSNGCTVSVSDEVK